MKLKKNLQLALQTSQIQMQSHQQSYSQPLSHQQLQRQNSQQSNHQTFSQMNDVMVNSGDHSTPSLSNIPSQNLLNS